MSRQVDDLICEACGGLGGTFKAGCDEHLNATDCVVKLNARIVILDAELSRERITSRLRYKKICHSHTRIRRLETAIREITRVAVAAHEVDQP